MLCLVLSAFITACLADFCADAAKTPRELGATCHETRRRGADGGAGAIEFDAAGHRLNILLLQTFRRTMLAGDGAVVTGVDTALIVLVWHIQVRNRSSSSLWFSETAVRFLRGGATPPSRIVAVVTHSESSSDSDFAVDVKKSLTGKVVGLKGFEPLTLRLSSACSNQLSYRPGLMTLAAPGKPTVVGVGGEVKARRDFVATRPALPVQPFNASTLQLFNCVGIPRRA